MAERPEMREIGPGVWTAPAATLAVGGPEVAALKDSARRTGRTQRLLLHPGVEDALHEMLIVHPGGIYIRPHLMAGTSKTYHLVEGQMSLVLFADDGRIERCLYLGASGSGEAFLARIMERRYHTLVVASECVAFVETLPGPFRGTVYADWAPEADGSETAEAYGRELARIAAQQERGAP